MDERYVLRQEDLVENPTARVPICLVLDVSGSMDGEPIRELNEGVELFFVDRDLHRRNGQDSAGAPSRCRIPATRPKNSLPKKPFSGSLL